MHVTIRHLVPITASMMMLGMIVMTSVSAQTAMRFRDTPAAQAFASGDYELALREFRALSTANPNNVLILRYLGITLDQLQRYEEAVDIFNEALALQPDMPALLYHLGVTYYNARRGELAMPLFRRCIAVAQDSEYAQFSAQYIDAIAQQMAQQQDTGKPERFGAYLQAGLQYNSNVPALPSASDVDTGDTSFSGYAALDYYLHRSPVWIATASVNAYGSWYRDEQFDAFETPQYGASLRLQRTGTLGSYAYIGSASYDYRKVELSDGDPYSSSHGITLGLRMNLSQDTSSYAFYRYTDDDFSDEGFDPLFSSRDADNHALGLTQTWYFAERQGQFSIGLDYVQNNATGDNFDQDGLAGRVSAIFPLPAQLRLDLDAVYGKDNYENFAGPVRRETIDTTFSARLSRWFGRHWLTRLDYSYLDEDSNYDLLSYDRSVWGINVNYVY